MEKLGPHGVTNEHLDEVSEFYRYRPESGEIWKHQPATATATITDGKVTGFTIVDGGFGYTTPPEVKVASYDEVRVKAELEFSAYLKTNGRVQNLSVID